jgi:hypothetical protein
MRRNPRKPLKEKKKAQMGRPPMAVCPSMGNAAGRLKLPLSRLKRWKAEGCTAFRNGRVYLRELQRWLKSDYPELWQTNLLIGCVALEMEQPQR